MEKLFSKTCGNPFIRHNIGLKQH